MAGSLRDKLPNRALSGPELSAITVKEANALLRADLAFAPEVAYKSAAVSIEADFDLGIPHAPFKLQSRMPPAKIPNLRGPRLIEAVLLELTKMMGRHYGFQGSVAYKRSDITLRITVHLGEPYTPNGATVECVITGEAPLPEPRPERTVVVGLERKFVLENPNIDRINHDMPIIVQRAQLPQAIIPENQLPGEPPTAVIGAPVVENLEFRYDATQFEAPAPAVDQDISQQAAARLGVPQHTGAQ